MIMASSLPILPSKPNPLITSSFLPPLPTTAAAATVSFKPTSKTTAVVCSSTPASKPKIVRCPSLDRHASSHNRLRFVSKLTTLLLSKPRHFLPLRVLSRCRPYLSLRPGRSLLSMIHRYPSIFRLIHTPSFSSPTSSSLLSVSLTPAAESLFSHISALRSTLSGSLAGKLHRLLLLSSHPRLLLSKLVHIAPDLGLPPNFRSRLCNSHPHLFRTVPTSYGTALELVDRHTILPVTPMITHNKDEDWRSRPIIDRPPKFKQVRLRRGLNLKRQHLDYLIRFQELPEINPYSRKADEAMKEEEKEKRACAVVREVLGMTVEKRTLIDHLTHFRKEFGLPNKLRGMLVRHPEMFYVSVKGQRDSVFLVEAYDDKGRLVVDDELLVMKERLMELVREGKRMRRERRRGIGLIGGDKDECDDDEEEDEEVGEYLEDDDGLRDLFESGIGDDWEDFGDGKGSSGDDGDTVGKEVMGFWSLKPASETSGNGGGGENVEAW